MCIRRNIEILYVKLNMFNLAHVKLVNDVSTHTFFYEIFFEHYANFFSKSPHIVNVGMLTPERVHLV